MKKRLLSAVLALAMALTMLPLSVFASPVATATEGNGTANSTAVDSDPGTSSGKTTVEYIPKADASKLLESGAPITEPGWYRYWTLKGTPNKKIYVKVDTGVVSTEGGSLTTATSGTWYATPNSTTTGKPLTRFTLLEDTTVAVDATTTSISADVNGHTLTVNGTETGLTSATFNDRRLLQGGTRGTVNWAITRDPVEANNRDTSKNLNITATNVKLTTISLSNWATHTVRLTNCEVGAISLTGKTDNTNSQTLELNQCILTGAVTVSGNSSRVTYTDTTGGQNLALTGTGATLTVNGVSNLGEVTLLATTDSTKKTAATPTVTVNGGTVSVIKDGVGEASTNPYKINVNAQGVVSSVTLTGGATLNVNQGTIQNYVSLGKTSSVTITGPRASVGTNLASGGITFVDGNKSSLKVTGTNNAIGNITCGTATNMNVDIAAEPTNTFGAVNLTGYVAGTSNGGGIKGGQFDSVLPSTALNSSLLFQLKKDAANGGKTIYYTASQLSNALDEQEVNVQAGTDAANPTVTQVDELSFVGQDVTVAKKNITFQNGSIIWGQLSYNGQSAFSLPTMVNGKNVQNWTVTDVATNKVINTYPAGGRYLTPSPDAELIMNAQSASADATKITNVSVKTSGVQVDQQDNVRATLNGNVFTLTGTVKSLSGFSRITLQVTTDLTDRYGMPIKVDVPVLYNNGITTFGNAQLSNGMVITPDFNSLRLSNDVTYTVNGSGLKAGASLLKNDVSSTEIDATINISGWTQLQKDALINAIEAGAFTWNQSPAILQAINAVQAGISDSQIKTWITQAQRQYWTSQNQGSSPTEADLTGTGYDTAWLVPYLAVNVTFWNETGVLNATLTPSYRVEVRSTKDNEQDVVPINGKLGSHDPIVVKAGATLGQLTGEMCATTYTTSTSGATTITTSGAPTVMFNLPSIQGETFYMHQDGTYAYQSAADGTYTITHAGSNGLGTIVINNTPGTISMKNPKEVTHGVSGDTFVLEDSAHLYDTLQAAVDDTRNGAQITIGANYTGSCAITMSGAARKVTITAQGNNIVTSNASGVVVTPDSSGHVYEVQLVADTAVTGNVVISAATVANGNVSLSTTRAAANSTVTITANPASGYSVTRITAKTNTGANVPVSSTGTNNKYTFTVPAGATSVTVTPEFAVAGQASIIVAPVANGSAVTNASGNVAQTNSTVTVTTTPNANYRTLGVSARTNTGASVAVTRSGNNLYYFTVPAGATSVTITPSFDLDTGMPFVDVLSTEFYLPYVQFVYKNGMMNGTEPTVFSGEQAITRGQLVAILWRQQGSPAAATYAGFVDVSASEYYASAITWAKNNKIVNGTSATTFEPDRAINRQEFATILYNFNNYLGKSTANQKNLNGYTDNGYVESWAKTAMQWCVGNGIISGDTPTTLSPYGTATRYQGATMLTRYCQNFLGMK